MQSSYSRWWEGRIQWDKLSAVSRSFARTVWLHVPPPSDPPNKESINRTDTIRCIHTLAVALKHHLRGEREWSDCADLKHLLTHIPNVCPPSLFTRPPSPLSHKISRNLQYNYAATNHPLTLTVHLSSHVEYYRTFHTSSTTPQIDTQVLTHLLTHIDTFTSIISACERLLRTPIPLGYNIAISRIVWIFILALPSQLWRELRWWSVVVTMVTAYALFALAEVGLEIENPWGEGPNDLDLDRYCNLIALDLGDVVAVSQVHSRPASIRSEGGSVYEPFTDDVDAEAQREGGGALV